MKKIFTFIILVILVCSCSRKVTKSIEKEEIKKDSVYSSVKETYKDSTFIVKADSAQVTLDDCNITEIPVVSETKGIKLTVKKEKGKLIVTALCKELELKIKLLQKEITNYQSQLRSKSNITVTEKIKEVKYKPWYLVALSWIGIIGLVVLGIKIYKKWN